jgi:hypothetical protein
MHTYEIVADIDTMIKYTEARSEKRFLDHFAQYGVFSKAAGYLTSSLTVPVG